MVSFFADNHLNLGSVHTDAKGFTLLGSDKLFLNLEEFTWDTEEFGPGPGRRFIGGGVICSLSAVTLQLKVSCCVFRRSEVTDLAPSYPT